MRLAKKGQLITHHKDKGIDIDENGEWWRRFCRGSSGNGFRRTGEGYRRFPPEYVSVTDKRLANCWDCNCSTISGTSCSVKNFIIVLLLKINDIRPSQDIRFGWNGTVMQTFDDTKAWNLPVVDEEGRYQDFLPKSKIFNSIPAGIGTFFRRLRPSDKVPGGYICR